jgi:dTDP-4-amino-4,6-dideoxygalactose transaminase
LTTKIPYGRQNINKDDLLIVSKSLKQPLITTGSFVKNFEKKLSKFLKVKNAITCNSGTAALHLAFLASDIKKGDVVIMPAINFISAYSMCKQLGAKIYLSDVDSKTGQMTPQLLVECIKENKIKKIKAVLTMYMGGFAENLLGFYKIKKKYKCLLIEDACHAFGADYSFNKKLIKVGACKHSDISTFSLHPLKPITTGEGGIVTTNNKLIAEKIKNYRSHGIIRDPKSHWKYDILNYGYNYRLSDINSALGISQLNKIKVFLKKRKKIYENYKSQLDKYKNIISFPKYNKKNKPSYHLVLININFNKTKVDKDMFLRYLNKKNIISQFHYIPIYKFKLLKTKNIKLKNSEKYYKSTLSIPIYHLLERKKQNRVINIIKNFFKDSKKL